MKKPKIKAYYHLTKPGIIRGNLITAAAGFLLASKGHLNLGLLWAVLGGIALIIASACVFNNYIDRDIDTLMDRTKQRALVTGLITPQNALIYAVILGLMGLGILLIYTNLLTVLVGLIGFVDYVFVYGKWKRRGTQGTIIGSISGATPPVAGYLAVTNHLDYAALWLFLILVFWQMPHFYAIAMYRAKDYAAAGIPVLPVKKGTTITKQHILAYIIAFTMAALALYFIGYTGKVYLIISAVLGISWFGLGLKGLKTDDENRWARKMFFFSLIVITVLCATISVDAILH